MGVGGAGSVIVMMAMMVVMIVMAVIMMMFVVVVVMVVTMLMVVRMLMIFTLDSCFAAGAAAYRTHYSTSNSLIRICWPSSTCN